MGSAWLAFLLAATAPDPGEPDFAALTALFVAATSTAYALARRLPREDVEWHGFIGAFSGGMFGLIVYLFGLVTDLY